MFRSNKNTIQDKSGTTEEIDKLMKIASITPTMALSEGPLLSSSSPAKVDRKEASGSSASTTASSITSFDNTVSLESDFKDEHEMKNVRQKLSSVMRKLRSETILRKEAEEQSKKLQREKLALESYLQNLPSLDEYQQIQTELEMKSITHQKINHQLEDARHEIDYKSKELSKSQRDVMNLQVEVEKLQNELKIEKSKNQRGQFASEASKSQTEKVLEEHEQLKQEKNKLMKYIVVTKSKHEKELNSLQKQLNSEKEQSSILSEKVESLVCSQTEAEVTSKHLRNQLENAFGQARKLQNELTIEKSKESETVERAADRSKLTMKLKSSVEEFERLTSTLCQMLDGDEDDINVSDLLGVDISLSEHVKHEAIGVDDFYQELFRIESVLCQSTNNLRDKVSNRYAENIATNSGCISQ